MCGCQKPYDPTAKRDSKASGFYGANCWDCHLKKQQETRSTEEGKAKANAAGRKARSTEVGRQKANAANVKSDTARRKRDAWFRLKKQLATETNRLLKQIGKGKSRDETIFAHFGADRETVFAYVDAQLTARGFKWEGHGTQWVLDHRKPLGLAQSSIELYQLCLLENCSALTPEENQKKGAEDQKLIRQHEA